MDTFASFSSFERKARFGLMAGQRLCLALWLIACLATATGAPAPEARASLSLDGKWQGRMDPERVGEARQWFSGLAPFRDQATVPGCWDSEGFGTEHEKARTNFTGRFWYKKTVRIPEDWQDQRIFLCIGGVHRTARTWVNDHYLGEHIGYLLAFEHDRFFGDHCG